ncbi:MAG: hypothetical protein QW390_03585 [Candidatus Bathyarchaeia archaeon]
MKGGREDTGSGLRRLFRKFLRRPPAAPALSLTGVEQPADLRSQIRILTVEREAAKAAVMLVQRAEEAGLIIDGDRRLLETRYREKLNALSGELSQKRRLLEIRELEETKKNLQESYLRKIDQIEERIKELRRQVLEESIIGPAPLAKAGGPPIPARVVEKDLKSLKNEIKRAMEKLEQIEVEG